MKHIKLFNNPQTADNFSIINVPFVTFIKSINKILTCKKQYKKLVHILDSVEVKPDIEMVNLNLTSGTLWAKTNIGATCGATLESWYGNYYAYGETEIKSNYTWDTYKYANTLGKLLKYCPSSKTDYWGGTDNPDNKIILDENDNVSKQVYDIEYTMPTYTDIQELISETNNSWIKNYNNIQGLNGYKFTSKTDSSKFIFIPAAGFFRNEKIENAGYMGIIWCLNVWEGEPDTGWILDFEDGYINADCGSRYVGCPVRAIKK